MPFWFRRTAGLALITLGLLPAFAFGQQPSDLVSRILALNNRLQSLQRRTFSARTAGPETAILAIARSRVALMLELIKTDPAAARSVMLSSEQADAIADNYPDLARMIETTGNWTGTLEQTVEDDFVHSTSRNHWLLHTPDDRRMELSFADGKDRSRFLNRRVTVSGVGIANVVSVESFRLAGPAINANTPACTTIGTQNTAVLIMNQNTGPAFSAGLDQATYWSPQYFSALPTKSVNSFWQETSFGVTTNTGQIFGPFTLDQNYSCNQTDALASAAITIAKTNGVDFSNFTRVSIIFPETTCGFGGLGNVGCRLPDSLISHPYSVTWIPALTFYDTSQVLWGLLAHEEGHNLGLSHSNSLDFGSIPLGAIDYTDSATASANTAINTEYGDPYTIMGGGSYTCGGQYTAFNKRQYLNWLDSGSVTEVTGSGTFVAVPFEQNSGVRGLRVLRDALTGSWIWLEYRQALGNFDNAFSICEPGSNVLQGVLGYYESPNSSDGRLYLLDFNPTSAPNNFADSALTPGHSWSDPYSLLTLTVNSADANGISITTSYDQPCATLAISAPVFAASGASGNVTVTAPGTCSWQASTAASWIQFTGTTSGTGNGTVPFTLSNNLGHDQRNSYITIQRQSIALAQKGTGTFISALSPVFQSGITKTITFTFDDPAGTNDIDNAQIYFQDYTSCEVYMDQTAAHNIFFFIYDNDAGSFTTSLTPGQNATISNSNCSLNGVGTSVTRVGNQLQLALNMTFSASFAGSHRVTAVVSDGVPSAPGPEISVGTFQTAPVPSVISVTPNVGRQNFSVPIVITGLNTHFTNSSTVAVSGTGVTSSAISASSATQLNATLTITDTATLGTRTLTITTGTEVVTSTFTVNGTGKVSLSNPMLTFASQDVGTTSAAQSIVLTNTGNAVLNIVDVVATGEFGVTTTCGTTLAVNATCNISATFQPLNYGTRTGAVIVHSDAPSNPNSASLTGTGQLSFIPGRPPRPPKPSTAPAIVSGATLTIPVETRASSAFLPRSSRTASISCRAPNKLECIVLPNDDPSVENMNLQVNAARTPPGVYIVVVTVTDGEDKKTFDVRVKVLRKTERIEQAE